MLSINIDNDFFDSRADLFGATDREIDLARVSALRLMRKKIEKMVIREVAAKHRIPQRALAGRVFSNKILPGDEELRVWIGTWNISPFSIGKPFQTAFGVRAGSKSYAGAFLASIYGGVEAVWIRLYSKHYDLALYPTDYRPGDRGLGSLRGRFPVVRAAIPIDAEVEAVLSRNENYFIEEFGKIFLRQLNYQVNVRGGLA